MLIASIADEVTGQGLSIQRIVVGAWYNAQGELQLLRDWELLQKLNTLGRSDMANSVEIERSQLGALCKKLISAIGSEASAIAESMVRPVVRGEMLLLPEPQ